MYVLVNGEMAQEDIDLAYPKKNVLIEVVIIQAKLSESFQESAIDKITAACEDIFDLGMDLETLQMVYNEGLRSSANIFRKVYMDLATTFPALHFRFVYASTGSEVPSKSQEEGHFTGREDQWVLL